MNKDGHVFFLSLSGPQLSALPLDSSLLLPPKAQPPVNNTSSAQPSSSTQEGEQTTGGASSVNASAPTGATIGQTEEIQGGASDSKGPPSSTPPANTPAENPEL